MQKPILILLGIFILLTACEEQGSKNNIPPDPDAAAYNWEYTTQPHLSLGPDGAAYLSWVENKPSETPRLFFAKQKGESWSEPQLIATGEGFSGNWADFLHLIVNTDGVMLAGFPKYAPGGGHASDMMLSLSRDHGKTWSEPFAAHDDGTATEHAFFSGIALPEGKFRIAWLDGRNMLEDDHGHGDEAKHGDEVDMPPMNLRSAVIDAEGRKTEEKVVDDRVCDCCQTDMVALPNGGALLVYRNRSEEEIRDIGILRLEEGKWSEVGQEHPDNWQIAGCPVNGPQADAIGGDVAVAWFTSASDSPRVYLNFSTDAGETFSPPLRIDDGQPVGRVAVALIDPMTAAVLWMERIDTLVDIRLKVITRTGEVKQNPKGIGSTLATVRSGRSSGFPDMVYTSGQLWVAWTENAAIPQVKTEKVAVSDDDRASD